MTTLKSNKKLGKKYDRYCAPAMAQIKKGLKDKYIILIGNIIDQWGFDKNNLISEFNLQTVADLMGFDNDKSSQGFILILRKSGFLVKTEIKDIYMVNPIAIMYGSDGHQISLIKKWVLLCKKDFKSKMDIQISEDTKQALGYTQESYEEINSMVPDIDIDIENRFNKDADKMERHIKRIVKDNATEIEGYEMDFKRLEKKMDDWDKRLKDYIDQELSLINDKRHREEMSERFQVFSNPEVKTTAPTGKLVVK